MTVFFHSYTVVQNFTTYWVMAESPAIQVSGQPIDLNGQPTDLNGQPIDLSTQPTPSEDTNTTTLIKAHGKSCQSLCTSES